MINVIVDRSRWLRGSENSRLLRDDGKMCCLGFVCLKLGYTEKEIKNKNTPYELSFDEMFGDFSTHNAQKNTVYDLMKVNDSPNIDDKKRESKIITLGQKIGIQFKFNR